MSGLLTTDISLFLLVIESNPFLSIFLLQILNKVVTVFAALCSEIDEHTTKVSQDCISSRHQFPARTSVSSVVHIYVQDVLKGGFKREP